MTQGKADPSVTDNGGHLPEEPVEKVSSVMWKGKHLDIDHMLKVARGEESGTITEAKVPSKAPDSSCASKETTKETVVTPSVQTPAPTVPTMSAPLHVNSNGTKNVGLPPSDQTTTTTTTQSNTQEYRPKTSTTREQTTAASSNEGDTPPASPRSRSSHVDAMKQAFEKKKSVSSSEGSPAKERRGSGASAFMNKLKIFGGKK